MGAYADTGNWGVGGFGMFGFSGQDDIRQLPVTSPDLATETDTGGFNGGFGGWISYDLEGKIDLPITLELAATWRFRHDLNIHYDVYLTKLNIMTVDTMLSLLYHIETDTPFTPYVGAGVGVAYLHSQNQHLFDTTNRDVGYTSDTNLVWQLQGGVNYALSDKLDIRLDYLYIDLGQVHTKTMPTSGSRFTADVFSHDIRIGVVWHF